MRSTQVFFASIWPYLLLIISVFISGTTSKTEKKWGQKSIVFDIDQVIFEGNLPQGTIYVPELNVISGIKVYKGNVYVTIPRYGHTGIPATLAKVTKREDGKVIFLPFPNWDLQKVGICAALQDARSIEVDPKTDLMYIADNGNGNCGPKLVIYDLAKNAVNATHPLLAQNRNDVKGINSLGDITVASKGVVYIANADTYGSLWILDTKNGKIYHVRDHSFKGTGFKPFVFENNTYSRNSSINMIALTPDSKFLLFSSDDQSLWQFEANMKEQLVSFQYGEIKSPRNTGKKNHNGFAILMGNKFLFFSNMVNKSISYWDRQSDLTKQNQGANVLVKETEIMIDIKPKLQYFPGKMTLDEDGYLWVVTMDLGMYFNETDIMDRRMKIVKIFVDNKPYNMPETSISGSGHMFISAIIVAACCLLVAI